MSSDSDNGLISMEDYFKMQGWTYLTYDEIITSLGDLYTNLVVGDQHETDIALKIAEITNDLKEYWYG